MAIIIGVISQKGGVGKSTISRLIAREFAAQGWHTKIGDLDISQATSFRWRSRRLLNGIEPDIPVEQYGRVDQALKIADQYDILVIDGAPHATQATYQIAKASDLIVIPTGLAVDDLEPGVMLAHELVQSIPRDRIVFALCMLWTQRGGDIRGPRLLSAGQLPRPGGRAAGQDGLPQGLRRRPSSDGDPVRRA